MLKWGHESKYDIYVLIQKGTATLDYLLSYLHFLGPVPVIFLLAGMTIAITRVLKKYSKTKRLAILEKDFQHWLGIREEPFCVPICPTNAMIKREDGIVYIDQEKCIGCMACAGSCPWTIPQLNPETKKAVKCDYCMDRVDAGLRPACVTKCTTHALKFVIMQEVV